MTNQTQVADQISFSHGRHTMRAGFEWEQNEWPITWSGTRGNFTVGSFNDLLVGGPQNTATGQPGNINQCLFCTRSAPQGIIHGYYAAGGSAFFQDDFKATSRLTLESRRPLGIQRSAHRQVWKPDPDLGKPASSRAAPAFRTDDFGPGVSQWVVPSNFTAHYGQPPDGVVISSNLTTERVGAPLSNFGPRIGFAYQVNNKLVVRGGAGIFFDRVGGDRIVYSVEQGNPYSATLDFNSLNNQTLANPFPATPVLGTLLVPLRQFLTGLSEEPERNHRRLHLEPEHSLPG